MKVAAIVVCAGYGRRFGSKNKIFASLGGRPLFYHAVKAFCGIGVIKQIIVVLRPVHMEAAKRFLPFTMQRRFNICFVTGGRQRSDSVRKGLAHLDRMVDYVLIHDGARPFLRKSLIRRLISTLKKEKAVICALAARDTLKKIDSSGYVRETLKREKIISVQTPQGFHKDILFAAYRRQVRRLVFDDSQLVEAIGVKVKAIAGDIGNFKITYPEDMRLAQMLMRAEGRGQRSKRKASTRCR